MICLFVWLDFFKSFVILRVNFHNVEHLFHICFEYASTINLHIINSETTMCTEKIWFLKDILVYKQITTLFTVDYWS